MKIGRILLNSEVGFRYLRGQDFRARHIASVRGGDSLAHTNLEYDNQAAIRISSIHSVLWPKSDMPSRCTPLSA